MSSVRFENTPISQRENLRKRTPAALPQSVAQSPRKRQREERVRRSARRVRLSGPVLQVGIPFLLLIFGTVLWGVAIQGIDPLDIRSRSMIDLLPPTFLAGLVVAVIAATLFAVTERALFKVALSVIAVMLHATHPLIFELARYPWTYKHLGITEQFMGGQSLQPSIDLYQRWIGFFAGSASIAQSAGIEDPEILARWSPLFFQCVLILFGGYLFRGIGGTIRQQHLASLLFLLGNWVAQDYFAPQASAYVLLVLLSGVVLRLVPARPRHQNPVSSFHESSAAAVGPPPSRALYVGIAIVCSLAITITHQITPIVVVLSAAALIFMFDLLHPRWLVVAFGGIFLGFVGVQLPWLDRRYGVLDFGVFGSSSVTKSSDVIEIGPVQSLAATGARGLTLLLVFLAAIFTLRTIRRERSTRLVALLAAVPGALVVMTSYGGEGIYRAFLFSLPWLCWLGAGTLTRVPQLLSHVVPIVACVLASLLFVVAYFGLESLFHVSKASTEASHFLYENADADATVVLASPTGFPIRYSPWYWRMAGAGRGSEGSLDMNTALRGKSLLPEDLPEINAGVDALRQGTGPAYLVVSTSQAAWAEDAGVWPKGALDHLNETLVDAPGWSLFLRNEDVAIWRRAPEPERQKDDLDAPG